MCRHLFVLAVLLASPQDEYETRLRRLTDDQPSVRDEELERFIRESDQWRARLEKTMASSEDPELRGRIRHILEEARFRERKARCRSALPERIRRDFPGFLDSLYSRDPDRVLEAVSALTHTYEAGNEGTPFRGLFLTPGEARNVFPELVAVLDPSPEFAKVRTAWVRALQVREEMLDDPMFAGWGRALFEDPDPGVRGNALSALGARVAQPQDLLKETARWEMLDANARWSVLRAIVQRKAEASYPFLLARMGDTAFGHVVVQMILQSRLAPLLPAATEHLRKNFEQFGFLDLVEYLEPQVATSLLVERLQGPAGRVDDALRILGRKGGPEAADTVAGFLAHKEWDIKLAAVDALSTLGGPRHAKAVAEVVRQYLRENDSSRRYPSEAIKLLDRWDAGAELESLIEYLPRIQEYEGGFSTALARLRPPGAGRKLAAFLDQGQDIGFRALTLMGQVGAREDARAHLGSIRKLIEDEKIHYGKQWAAMAVAELGLIELLPILVANVRHSGFQPIGPVLCRLWSPEQRRAALSSAETKMREAGIKACLSSGDPEEADAAIAAGARDPEQSVRWTTAASCVHPLSERSSALLAQLSCDPDSEVARAAGDSYFRGRPSDFHVPKNLLPLLRHAAAGIRSRALDYVSSEMLCQEPGLIEALRKDPDESVRKKFQSSVLVLDDAGTANIKEQLSREKNVSRIFRILYDLGRVAPAERTTPLLQAFFARILSENPTTIEPETYHHGHGDITVGLGRVAEQAGQLATKAGRPELVPVLLKLLASERTELQKAGAAGLGPVKCPEAIPRLVELLPSSAGDAAAEALGRLGTVPPEIFGHPAEAVRVRAFKAARICRNHDLFGPALAAVQTLNSNNLRDAAETLGELARREDVPRLLELARHPRAEVRGAAIWQASRFVGPDLAASVAEFLDDNYMVHWRAAEVILASDDARHAAKAARRTLAHFPDRAARLVHRFALQEEAALLVPWLDVPGNPVMDTTAVEVVTAFASLGRKEYLPAAVSKMRIVGPRDRPAMIRAVARLGGRDAVPAIREELKHPDRKVRLSAAETLVTLGDVDLPPQIRVDVVDDLHSLPGMRLLINLRWTEVCEEAIRRGEKAGSLPAGPWIAALRLGMPGAPAKVAKALQESAEPVSSLLAAAWGLTEEVRGWDGYDYYYRPVRDLIAKVERKSGRKVVLKGPLPEGLLDRVILAGSLDSLLWGLQGKWAVFIDDEGRIVVDQLEAIQRAWAARLR